MSTSRGTKIDRAVKLLARGAGLWDGPDRRCVRIVSSAGLSRFQLSEDVRSELHARRLATSDDAGIRLTSEGRALAARLSDHPDAHRLQHGAIVAGGGPRMGGAAPSPMIDMAESPLKWLHSRKGSDGHHLIDAAEFSAGERLRADFTRAGMMPSVTSNWRDMAARGGGPGGRADLTDAAIAARGRVTAALSILGPELAGVALDVCCFLKGLETVESERCWPSRCAKVVLKLALRALARHYGIAAAVTGPEVSRRSRHWGADDYRPDVRGGSVPSV